MAEGPVGCSAPTWACRSPAWPDPTPRTTSRPARSSWAWPARASRPSRSRFTVPGRPGPGPPVRHHRRARPAASDPAAHRPPELGAPTAGRPARSRPARPVAVDGAGRRAPARPGPGRGAPGCPSGTSSTQVLPGCRVIGAPAGGGQRGRLGEARTGPGAGDGHAVAHHHQRAGPGGRHVDLAAALAVLDPATRWRSGTVMITTLVAAVWVPVEQLVGRAGVGAQVVAGRRVPLPGHVRGGRERDVDAEPRTGHRPGGQAWPSTWKIGAGGVVSDGSRAHSAAVLANVE